MYPEGRTVLPVKHEERVKKKAERERERERDRFWLLVQRKGEDEAYLKHT